MAVIGRVADVGVVEVKPSHLLVMVRRSMHVRGPGDESERQDQGTAKDRERFAHLADCTRRRGEPGLVRP
jgi:hypothetical protein